MLFSKLRTILIGSFLLLLSFMLAFPDVSHDLFLTDEDRWIENITALAFLVAAILFFVTYRKTKGDGLNLTKFKTKRNLIFIFLSFLFFFAFGEEISWGQRIFNWATPDYFTKFNYQQETNIHNLDFFTFKDETDDGLLSFFLVFNAGRLFFYFWFTFLVLIPLLDHYSPRFHRLFAKFRIPIASFHIGLLMISNLILAKIFIVLTRDLNSNFSGSIDEIQEANYAVLILLLSIHLKKKYSRKTAGSTPVNAEN